MNIETTVGPASSWRLVHDGSNILTLFESSGYTTTTQHIFEAATEAECCSEATRLGMHPLPVVELAVANQPYKPNEN